MIEVEESIYKNLNLDKYTEFCSKWGNKPPVLVGQIISELLVEGSGPKAMENLGRSAQTFNRSIKKLFPDVVLKGRAESWKYWLITKSDYKKCSNCETYLKREFFNKDSSTSDGIANICKSCREVTRDKEYHVNYTRQHYLNNKEYYTAKAAKYRANKLQRLPLWADLRAIEEFYFNCPIGYHVDHIYPLNGESVSGLHVLNNLQYLTAEDNLKKGNKFPNVPDRQTG